MAERTAASAGTEKFVRRAGNWEVVTGDAGWAGVIAEYFLESPEKGFYIVFDPDIVDQGNLMVLFSEIADLFPEENRNLFTYSTLYGGDYENCDCFLRALPVNDPRLDEIFSQNRELCLLLDAAGPIPEKYESSPLVDLARNRKTERPSRHEKVSVDEDFAQEIPENQTGDTSPPSAASGKKTFLLLIIILIVLLLILGAIILFLPGRSVRNPGDIKVLQENLQIN